MQDPTKIDSSTSIASTMPDNEAISSAISDLNSQEAPNIAKTARKYEIHETTLGRRWKGQTVSDADFRSRSLKLLTDAQESVLIEYIKKLSARNMHPTPQMVENLVREITKRPVGERWVERFRKRHSNEFTSRYLRNIDQSRHVADNSKHFQHYFDNVSVESACYAHK